MQSQGNFEKPYLINQQQQQFQDLDKKNENEKVESEVQDQGQLQKDQEDQIVNFQQLDLKQNNFDCMIQSDYDREIFFKTERYVSDENLVEQGDQQKQRQKQLQFKRSSVLSEGGNSKVQVLQKGFVQNLVSKNYMLNYVRSKENLLYELGKNKKRHKTESESILKCISELSMDNWLIKGGCTSQKIVVTQGSEDSDQSVCQKNKNGKEINKKYKRLLFKSQDYSSNRFKLILGSLSTQRQNESCSQEKIEKDKKEEKKMVISKKKLDFYESQKRELTQFQQNVQEKREKEITKQKISKTQNLLLMKEYNNLKKKNIDIARIQKDPLKVLKVVKIQKFFKKILAWKQEKENFKKFQNIHFQKIQTLEILEILCYKEKQLNSLKQEKFVKIIQNYEKLYQQKIQQVLKENSEKEIENNSIKLNNFQKRNSSTQTIIENDSQDFLNENLKTGESFPESPKNINQKPIQLQIKEIHYYLNQISNEILKLGSENKIKEFKQLLQDNQQKQQNENNQIIYSQIKQIQSQSPGQMIISPHLIEQILESVELIKKQMFSYQNKKQEENLEQKRNKKNQNQIINTLNSNNNNFLLSLNSQPNFNNILINNSLHNNIYTSQPLIKNKKIVKFKKNQQKVTASNQILSNRQEYYNSEKPKLRNNPEKNNNKKIKSQQFIYESVRQSLASILKQNPEPLNQQNLNKNVNRVNLTDQF